MTQSPQVTSSMRRPPTSAMPSPIEVAGGASPDSDPSAPPLNGLHGRDLAESFMRNYITNPLIRAKEKR